jgi:hypothetical protein
MIEAHLKRQLISKRLHGITYQKTVTFMKLILSFSSVVIMFISTMCDYYMLQLDLRFSRR